MIKRLDGKPYTIPVIEGKDLKKGQVFGQMGMQLNTKYRFLVLSTGLEGLYQEISGGRLARVSGLCYDYPLDESVGTGLDGQLHVTAVTPL